MTGPLEAEKDHGWRPRTSVLGQPRSHELFPWGVDVVMNSSPSYPVALLPKVAPHAAVLQGVGGMQYGAPYTGTSTERAACAASAKWCARVFIMP